MTNRDPINHPDAFTPPPGELDPARRELILLVNAHGSPVAVRALADLLNEEHRLRKQRDAVLKRHRQGEDAIFDRRIGSGLCEECDRAWPCRTVRALGQGDLK